MELKTAYYKDIHRLFATHTVATKSLKKGNNYANYIKWFFLFLEQKGIATLRDVTTNDMKEYLHHLTTRPKLRGEGCLSISSINENLSTIGMLVRRLIDGNEKILLTPFAIPKLLKEPEQEHEDGSEEYVSSLTFKIKRHILTTDEVKEVYEACQNSLERALIALAYGCGMRRSSLEELEEKHIDFVHGTIIAESDKFNKTRTIPISDFFLDVLRTYTEERLQLLLSTGQTQKRFFINHLGKPIDGEKLNEIFKGTVARTNNPEIISKKITLHCLRHSIATHLIDAGQPFEYVRKFLGHAEIDTTTVYAKRRKIKNYYTI